MLYIGIDFGSTYTIVSVYQEETQKLEALTLSEGGTPFIPSVLAVSKNQIFIGREAKSMTGKKGAKCFRSFKMMLTEADRSKLVQRGFDEKYTPAQVTHDFIEQVLRQILHSLNETMIEHLVIGVPEIWSNAITTIDGRGSIRNIGKSLPFVKAENVQVVSEPAAASAFFAHNFKQITNSNFNGTILLIDYGGGTLDITLTDVETRPDEGGTEGMEIRVLYRTGAGENEEGKIGKASIVYMETLMETAIKEVYPDLTLEYDAKFYKAVDELEVQLQECTGTIKTIFDEYGTDAEDLAEDVMEEEDFIFTTVYYKGEEIDISYQMMVQVYDKIIRPVFHEKLEEVIEFMNKESINYMKRNDDDFKIVLVGGFGNYYLVRKQVTDVFKFSSKDSRQEHVIRKREDCEKAISLGAAVLSAGIVRIRNTAPYSIGVCLRHGGTVSLTYGLRHNQDIEFEKIYFQKDRNGHLVKVLTYHVDIECFLIKLREDYLYALKVYPKEEIQKKLQSISTPTGVGVFGFSVDSSGIISLHVFDYDIYEGAIKSEVQVIELSNFRELFDMQSVERVDES